MEPWVIATGLIFLYILVTLVLGFVANRRLTIDLDDFFLYGRKAGFGVLYLTVVATYHSAFAFLGRCCTALAESKMRLWWWPRYVRP